MAGISCKKGAGWAGEPRRRGICLAFLLAFLFILAMVLRTEAAERVPVKIAQMPILTEAVFTPIDDDTMDSLETQIDRAVHIPLNGTLHAVEFLPSDDVISAYQDVLAKSGKRRYKDLVRPMAESLGADIVVLPVITRYETYQRMSWRWDCGIIRYSAAAVTLAIYDRKSDRVINKSAFRSYDDDLATWNEVAVLAHQCMDQVLQETELHQLVTSEALPKDAGDGAAQGK